MATVMALISSGLSESYMVIEYDCICLRLSKNIYYIVVELLNGLLHIIFNISSFFIQNMIILHAGRVGKQFFLWGEARPKVKLRLFGAGESLKTRL
jgi:hypothetical protein